MKQYVSLVFFMGAWASSIAMDGTTQSPDPHATSCMRISDYWGSICGFEFLIRECMARIPNSPTVREPYYKHSERVLDDWLFQHPRALAMTIEEAAASFPDLFMHLPDAPIDHKRRAHYLQSLLKEIFQCRVSEYHKYYHDVRRGTKASPAEK